MNNKLNINTKIVYKTIYNNKTNKQNKKTSFFINIIGIKVY